MTEKEFEGLKKGMNVFRTYMQGPVICKVSNIEEGKAFLYEIAPVKNGFLGTIDRATCAKWHLTMVKALEDGIAIMDRLIEDKTVENELKQKFISAKKMYEALLKRAREKAQEKAS